MFSWKNSVVNDRKKWTFQIFIPKYLTLLLKLYQIYTVSLTGKSLHQLTHNMATDCSLFMKIVSSDKEGFRMEGTLDFDSFDLDANF